MDGWSCRQLRSLTRASVYQMDFTTFFFYHVVIIVSP